MGGRGASGNAKLPNMGANNIKEEKDHWDNPTRADVFKKGLKQIEFVDKTIKTDAESIVKQLQKLDADTEFRIYDITNQKPLAITQNGKSGAVGYDISESEIKTFTKNDGIKWAKKQKANTVEKYRIDIVKNTWVKRDSVLDPNKYKGVRYK